MQTIVLTKTQLTTLVDIHIDIYKNRIEHGGGETRFDECRQYLKLWESAKYRLSENRPIEKRMQAEIYDALFSGEFNDRLGLGELEEEFSLDFDYVSRLVEKDEHSCELKPKYPPGTPSHLKGWFDPNTDV